MRVLLVDLETAWRGGQSQALLLLRGCQRSVARNVPPFAGQWDEVRLIRFPVEIDHQPRPGAQDGGTAEPPRQGAGQRAGADIDRDMFVEQSRRNAEIDAGWKPVGRMVGDQ